MLEFDEKGNLIPHNHHIEISYDVFVKNFVKNFPIESTRHQILTDFERFLEEFCSKIYSHFNIWINGSFVTQKVNPNDIRDFDFKGSERPSRRAIQLTYKRLSRQILP